MYVRSYFIFLLAWVIPTTLVASGTVGEYHQVLISNGSLWSWGINNTGQLGLGDVSPRQSPTQIGVDSDWADVVAGTHHNLAIKEDGRVFVWGSNEYGALGANLGNQVNTPTEISLPEAIESITAGDHHSFLVATSGNIYACGRNQQGQLGLGNLVNTPVFSLVGLPEAVVKASAGSDYSIALGSSGTVYVWGSNGYGQLGLPGETQAQAPMALPSNQVWTDISAGGFQAMAIDKNNDLYHWGKDVGTLSGNLTSRTPNKIMGGVILTSAGREHLQVLSSSGNLWSSGSDKVGQLGRSDPDLALASLSGNAWFHSLSRAYHSLAIKTNGQVEMWGKTPWTAQAQHDVPTTVAFNLPSAIRIRPITGLSSGQLAELNAGTTHTGGSVWNLVWGPSTGGSFSSNTSLQSNFSTTLPGIYRLELRAHDGSAKKSLLFHVEPAVFGSMIWGQNSWNRGREGSITH